MSSIEWTQETWNPITGCSKISPGCKNCYAERMACRLREVGQPQYQGVTEGKRWTGKINFVENALQKPMKGGPKTYFVNSMSDLFHESVKTEWVDGIWQVMRDTPDNTYQVLTKRAGIMRSMGTVLADKYGILPNVWLGVSVENQPCADERIEELRQTPAAIRFLSMEPLLEPVDIKRWLWPDLSIKQWFWPDISWVIVGGESGPGARPFHMEWAGQIIEQCEEADVPVFVKQMGSNPYWCNKPAKGFGRKGNDPSLWPQALNIRQMPAVAQSA